MISVDANQVMIEHYIEIRNVTSSEIKIQMKQYRIAVRGKNLHVAAMSKYEIFIKGDLEGVIFEYEKETEHRTR